MAQKGKPTKPSTLAMDRSRIESQVKPLLGERAVHSLTLDGSKGMQADIATGRWTSPLGVQGDRTWLKKPLPNGKS